MVKGWMDALTELDFERADSGGWRLHLPPALLVSVLALGFVVLFGAVGANWLTHYMHERAPAHHGSADQLERVGRLAEEVAETNRAVLENQASVSDLVESIAQSEALHRASVRGLEQRTARIEGMIEMAHPAAARRVPPPPAAKEVP